MKNYLFKTLTLALLSVFLLTACSKKDKDTTPSDSSSSGITGKYRVTEGLHNHKYFQITNNQLISYGRLMDLNRRYAPEIADYEMKKDTMVLDGYPHGEYVLKEDGGKLTLVPTSSNFDEVILSAASEEEVPDPEEWTPKLEIEEVRHVDLKANGNGIDDITIYNNHIYSNGYYNPDGDYVIAKISTGGSLEEIPIPSGSEATLGYASMIVFIDDAFWIQKSDQTQGKDGDLIYQFDPETLESKDRVEIGDESISTVYTMAANSDESRIYANTYDGIRKLDWAEKKYGEVREVGGSSNPIAIQGDKLYEVRNNVLHEFVLPDLSASTMGYQLDKEKYVYRDNMAFWNENLLFMIAERRDDGTHVLLKVRFPEEG